MCFVNKSVKRCRFFITEDELLLTQYYKFNDNIPDTCIKCEQEKGTLFHSMWEREEIAKFWRGVSHAVYNMLDINLPLHPKLFILKLINMCLLHAECLIALSWKNGGDVFLPVSGENNLHFEG